MRHAAEYLDYALINFNGIEDTPDMIYQEIDDGWTWRVCNISPGEVDPKELATFDTPEAAQMNLRWFIGADIRLQQLMEYDETLMALEFSLGEWGKQYIREQLGCLRVLPSNDELRAMGYTVEVVNPK